MKKILLSGVAVAALTVAPAMAADIPTKAPSTYYTPAYNWTGAYIGINAGGGWLKDNDDGNRNGGLIGGTLGYNFQPSGPWVWA